MKTPTKKLFPASLVATWNEVDSTQLHVKQKRCIVQCENQSVRSGIGKAYIVNPRPARGTKWHQDLLQLWWYTVWIWGIQHIKKACSPNPPPGISVSFRQEVAGCLAATDTAAATWQQAFVLQEQSKTSKNWMSRSYCCIPAMFLQLSDKHQRLRRTYKDSQKHRIARDLRRSPSPSPASAALQQVAWEGIHLRPWLLRRRVHRPWAAVPASHSREVLPCVCMELPVFQFSLLHKHLIENKTACPALSNFNYRVFIFQNISHRKKPGSSSE